MRQCITNFSDVLINYNIILDLLTFLVNYTISHILTLYSSEFIKKIASSIVILAIYFQ